MGNLLVQSSIVAKELPHLTKRNAASIGDEGDLALENIGDLTMAISTADLIQNKVLSQKCRLTNNYKFVTKPIEEDEVFSNLKRVLSTKETPMRCCTNCWFSNAIWIQSIEENILCCSCRPLEIDSIDKASAIIGAMKSVVYKISREPETKGCLCCSSKLPVSKEFLTLQVKAIAMSEVERIFIGIIALGKRSTVLAGQNSEAINEFYNVANRDHRVRIDKMIFELIRSVDFPVKRIYLGPSFENEYNVENVTGDIGEYILRNYMSLNKDGIQFIPKNLGCVFEIIHSHVDILYTSARIKSVESVKSKHKTGNLFDMFGYYLNVDATNKFLTFSRAMKSAVLIKDLPTVRSVALKFILNEETSFMSLIMVIQLSIDNKPIVEIQFLPVQNRFSDMGVKGHDKHDLEAQEVNLMIR
jgi:hypothetical protein